jgi:hypothetical protein
LLPLQYVPLSLGQVGIESSLAEQLAVTLMHLAMSAAAVLQSLSYAQCTRVAGRKLQVCHSFVLLVVVLYVLGLKTSVLPTSIWHSQMCQ